MIKHYVSFDTPGVFFPETETRRVTIRIPSRLKRIPKYTYAIEYFDREEVAKNGETLSGKSRNKSTRIIFGKVFTKDELLKAGFGRHTPLYHNADNSDGKVIKCITGNWQPWDNNWIILTSYSELRNLESAI